MLPLPPLLLGDLVDERVHALEETPHRYSTARTPEPLQESLLELSLCQPLLVLPDEVPHELRGGSKAPLLRAVPHVVKEFLGHRDVEGLHTSPDTTRQRISRCASGGGDYQREEARPRLRYATPERLPYARASCGQYRIATRVRP